MFLLGRLIDVPRACSRNWSGGVAPRGIGLRVSTAVGDDVLLEPDAGFPMLTLEMREDTLHRCLLRWVDLAARLREGTGTAYRAHGPVQEAGSRAIPWTSLAFNYLNWIRDRSDNAQPR